MGCDVEPRWGSRVTGAVIPGCDTQHHRINPEGVAQLGTKRVSIGGWHEWHCMIIAKPFHSKALSPLRRRSRSTFLGCVIKVY
jgi:hypothetical protein